MRLRASVAALLLAGCRVGPELESPKVDLPLPAQPGGSYTTGTPWTEWWKEFRDGRLDTLVGEAIAGSQDLRAAAARVQAARALARVVGSGDAPQLSGDAAVARQQRSAEAFGRNGQALGVGQPFTLWSATLDATWEIDLFGRVGSAEAAALADARAADEDRNALVLTVASDVAQSWFDLAAANEELEILGETVVTRERSLRVVGARQGAGLATELELRQAEGALEAVRAGLPIAEQRRAVAEHRLALLSGKPPGQAYERLTTSAFTAPPVVPVGLPAELLRRRPDLRAAEQRLVASNARLCAAIAEFYPSVTLVGSFGYEARELAHTGKASTELWSIGPAVRVPLFTGGRLRAEQLLRESEQDEASALYVRQALAAFAEVADAIAAIDAARASAVSLEKALAAEARARRLAEIQYEQGLTSYLTVLDSQRGELTAKLAWLANQRKLLGAIVQLCKALGGGW